MIAVQGITNLYYDVLIVFFKDVSLLIFQYFFSDMQSLRGFRGLLMYYQ